MLAAAGWLHPVAAAAIMFASSLTVVALATRVNSHKQFEQRIPKEIK